MSSLFELFLTSWFLKVRTLDDANGIEVERNAFWLLGVEDDFYTIQQIKVSNPKHKVDRKPSKSLV